MAVKEIHIPFTIPVLILIENTFTTFRYSSFSRGYHVHKDAWIPIIGDDSLTCERKEHNENDTNAVTIVWYGCVSKKIVGHIPLNCSKVASRILQFTNHQIREETTGKKVNRGVG